MNFPVVILAGLTLVTGLVAARYWYLSSQVPVVPAWAAHGGIEPGNNEHSQSGWIVALMESARESGRLNKIASLWTAAAVVLGAATSIVGAVG